MKISNCIGDVVNGLSTSLILFFLRIKPSCEAIVQSSFSFENFYFSVLSVSYVNSIILEMSELIRKLNDASEELLGKVREQLPHS